MKKVLFGLLLFFVLGTGIVFGQTLQNKTFTEWQSVDKFNNFVYSETANHAKQLVLIKQVVEKEFDAVVQNLLHHQVEQTRAGIEEYLLNVIERLNDTVLSLQTEYGYYPPESNELFVENFESKFEINWNPYYRTDIE